MYPPEIAKPRRVIRYSPVARLLLLALPQAVTLADGKSPTGFGLAACGLSSKSDRGLYAGRAVDQLGHSGRDCHVYHS